MTKSFLEVEPTVRPPGRSAGVGRVVGAGVAAAGLVGLDALVAYAYRPRPSWVVWSGWISLLGSGAVALGVSSLVVIAAWLWRNDRLRRCGFAVLTGIVVGGGLTFVLKSLVGRLRPYAMDGPWEFLVFHPLTVVRAWQSFPSGHAMVMGVWVETLRRFYPTDRRLRWGAGIATAVVILARVAGKFHHPSDVVAGYVLGVWVARWVVGRQDPLLAGRSVGKAPLRDSKAPGFRSNVPRVSDRSRLPRPSTPRSLSVLL